MASLLLTLAAPQRRSPSKEAFFLDIRSRPFRPATHRQPPSLAPVRTSDSAPALETTDCRIAPPSHGPISARSPAGKPPATASRSVPAGDNPPSPLPHAGNARCAPADIPAVNTRSPARALAHPALRCFSPLAPSSRYLFHTRFACR